MPGPLRQEPAWDGGHARRKELAEDPRGVFAAPGREVALGLASESAARWRGSHPGVAENLEELFEECLPGVSPRAHPHHKRPRTSQSEEIKRRTRVVRIFPDREAFLRLVSALAIEQPEEWLIGRRYPDMEELQRVALALTRARHAHASG
jgi:transposase-like protein